MCAWFLFCVFLSLITWDFSASGVLAALIMAMLFSDTPSTSRTSASLSLHWGSAVSTWYRRSSMQLLSLQPRLRRACTQSTLPIVPRYVVCVRTGWWHACDMWGGGVIDYTVSCMCMCMCCIPSLWCLTVKAACDRSCILVFSQVAV